MSSHLQAQPLRSSPLTRLAVTALQNLYPESLADGSFDNTGLLLEAPDLSSSSGGKKRSKVLLTIDLTTAVADEAVARGAGVVVAYHPIIFHPLKSLTLANTQQATLLKLAAHGISVYCPHTAVDAAEGGNADWLADCLTGHSTYVCADCENSNPINREDDKDDTYRVLIPSDRSMRYDFSRFGPGVPRHVGGLTCKSQLKMRLKHSRAPIVPSSSGAASGMGRVVTLEDATVASNVLLNLSQALGMPQAFNVGVPSGRHVQDVQVKSVAVCAGSGGSVIGKCEDEVDMLVTGEMSHHECLAAVEAGKIVVCLGHSNSERGYLSAVMRGKLKDEMMKVMKDEGPKLKRDIEDVDVIVCDSDQDPFGTLVRSP